MLAWLQQTGFFSSLRDSAFAYPVLLASHFVSLAIFAGTIVARDLRLLGLGMRSYPVAELLNGLRTPQRVGFFSAVVTGALLFGAKAEQDAHNPWFWIKLGLLALIAVISALFRRSVWTAPAGPAPFRAKLAGAVSLLLWGAVVCAARGPATIKDIMHSMVNPSAEFLFQSVQQIADDRGAREKGPETDAAWQDVRDRLGDLIAAPGVLTARGRRAAHVKDRSRSPEVESEPADIQQLLETNRPDFDRRARILHDAAAVALRAADAKGKDALFHALDGIDRACESCHLHYWYPKDQRAKEAAREAGLTD